MKCSRLCFLSLPFQHVCCIVVMLAFSGVPLLQADTREEDKSVNETRIQQAIDIMDSYAQRTGLTSEHPRQRYLWTDAFAVCNYLGLARSTGNPAYTDTALKLIDQVHQTLGRHRDDDPRSGWISGLDEDEGEHHPTRGGLRIGKPRPERTPDEALDERIEWDRDGQYFHYLGKWMHALDQATRATGQLRYNRWGRELASAAFDAFSYQASGDGQRRMVWKMSIDLSRALVPMMGKHDPLDGYITSQQLAATAASLARSQRSSADAPQLDREISGFAQMVSEGEWRTDDPLGIGGLLVDAYRLQQLLKQGAVVQPQLLEILLEAALSGLQYYVRSGELQQTPQYRLAFRELGLAIGLHAVESMQQSLNDGTRQNSASPHVRALVGALMHFTHVREHIENYWLHPIHQQSGAWIEHRDINEVMLATSLAPDGMLELPMPASGHKADEALLFEREPG